MIKKTSINKLDPYQKTILSAYNISLSLTNMQSHPANDILENVIITSTHKTYKYIFINGLLGHATAKHNPLCLQKSSALPNSWDARSICHDVLCPFEREYLDNKLGASNEPFLNKPARFQELSESNAVRRGKNRTTLNKMIELFSSIKTKEESFILLCNALYLVLSIKSKKLIESKESIETGTFFSKLINSICEKNHEGQSLAFSTALIYSILLNNIEMSVNPHKVNQSGSSSKEICDIDVYDKSNTYVLGIEVKDKLFNKIDYEHAKIKVISNKGNFLFLTRELYRSDFLNKLSADNIDNYDDIVTIEQLLNISAININNLQTSEFINLSNNLLDTINVTDTFRLWVRETFKPILKT